MIKLLITIFLGAVMTIASVITAPVNALITTYFPDISSFMQNVISIYDNNIVAYIGFFLDLIPTNVLAALLTYINFGLTCKWYFEPLYQAVTNGLRFIKKLPFM